MTTIEYFQKMLNKHLINYEHELQRNVSEEILENIQFKIDCCKAAIDSLTSAGDVGHWEEVETSTWARVNSASTWVRVNPNGTVKTAKRKYFRCNRCGRCNAIKEKYCPECGRRMVEVDAQKV